jgi:heme oxygenase
MTVMTVLGPRSDAGGRIESQIEHALDVLRYETRPYTLQLHRQARLARIATRADYADTLTLLLGFYRPLDRWFASSLAPLRFELELARRARAPSIGRDLAALGAALSAVRFHPAPLRTGTAYALGWLYGIEIAALGGRMMGKRLRDQLGMGPDSGGAFFDGHGAETHAMWEQLAGVIARRVVREGDLAAASDGAVDFFAALIDWLSLPRRAAA